MLRAWFGQFACACVQDTVGGKCVHPKIQHPSYILLDWIGLDGLDGHGLAWIGLENWIQRAGQNDPPKPPIWKAFGHQIAQSAFREGTKKYLEKMLPKSSEKCQKGLQNG